MRWDELVEESRMERELTINPDSRVKEEKEDEAAGQRRGEKRDWFNLK